jgi:hypothetical protein
MKADEVVRLFNIPFSIKEGVVYNNMAVVITNDSENQNVVAINHDGKILWRIPVHPWANWRGDNVPYVGVGVNDNSLYVISFGGFRLRLDPATGEVLEAYDSK